MAFYDDLLAVFDKYNVGLPPHLAQQLYQLNVPAPAPAPGPTVNLPAGCIPVSIPGTKGLVKMLGAFKGEHWANLAYAISEVGATYPKGSDEQNFVYANVEGATESYVITGFFGACKPVDGQGRANGEAIQGTQACPDHGREGPFLNTVAAAYAHFSQLDEPVTNDGSGFHA